MYLHISLIQCCRYLCGNRCICTDLIFAVADAFFETDVSALAWYSLLQMLFLESMYLQLTFLRTCRYFQACLSCKLHLHLAFSMTWVCFPQKFCILSLPFLHLADTPNWIFASSLPENPLSQILLNISRVHSLHGLSRYIPYKNWYKKFERIWNERWRHLKRKFLC